MACGQQKSLISAPLGDRLALEKLAEAYQEIRSGIAINPTQMRPEGKRKFIELVFERAGFNYYLTLLALAKLKKTEINQYHKDLKQLAFLPHTGLLSTQLKDLYAERELKAIVLITSVFDPN